MSRTAAQIAAKLPLSQRVALGTALDGEVDSRTKPHVRRALRNKGLLPANGGLCLTTEGLKVKILGSAVGAGQLADDHAEALEMNATRVQLVQVVTWLVTYTLKREDGEVIAIGDRIQDIDDGDDFVITGAEWNHGIDETRPALLGYWPSIGQDESHAGGACISIFSGVRWTWLANN